MKALGYTIVLAGAIWALLHVSLAAILIGSLAFGTPGFWLLVALSTVILFTAVEYDNGVGATLTLLAAFLLLQFFGDVKVFSYIQENPWFAVRMTLAYFAAGTLWSIVKWWFYVRKERENYDEARADFMEGRGLGRTDPMPDRLKIDWARYAPKKPSAAKSKEKILRWMSFWPWSLVWTMINDPIKKAFKTIYRNIQHLLQTISDKAFEGTELDLR